MQHRVCFDGCFSGRHKITVENLPDDMSWTELKDLGKDSGLAGCLVKKGWILLFGCFLKWWYAQNTLNDHF